MHGPSPNHCNICSAHSVTAFRSSTRFAPALHPDQFRITDSAYGKTLPLARCEACGFVQLAEATSVLPFYRQMEDPVYEATRESRAWQAKRLIAFLSHHLSRGRLLDVGAGTGIMVEEANRAGFDAEGLEPSRWMVERARARGLNVREGQLPGTTLPALFDAITMVDVLEHVTNPLEFLRSARGNLKPGGWLLVVTPDLNSVAAKLLGARWWHFRIAHVCYFNATTLQAVIKRAGFETKALFRPAWSLPVGYLAQRLRNYIPGVRAIPLPNRVAALSVRINLRDSWAALCRVAP